MINDLKKLESWYINHSSYKDSNQYNRIDYKYKAILLRDTELLKESSKLSYLSFVSSHGLYDKDNNLLDYEFLDYDTELQKIIDRVGVCAYLESLRLNNSRYHRQQRLSKRIETILFNKSYFLTLTFKNDYVVIPSRHYMSPKIMRDKVQRFLKNNFNDYVANIDYGAKNGRIHFHAVASATFVDPSKWRYGNLDFEIIFTNNNDKLCKYIDKLTNHAIKETTRRNHLLYARKSKKSLFNYKAFKIDFRYYVNWLDFPISSMLSFNCE